MKMNRRARLALGLSLPLAACEKPTAPEAREIAREITRRFEHGDVNAINGIFTRMGQAGYFRWTNLARNMAMEVAQDGVVEMINGYVVEEELRPAGGYGGPVTQRTLVGWPNDYGFAVFATTESNPGVFERHVERRHWVPYTTMALHRPDTLDSWVALSGQVHITDAIIDRECQKQGEGVPYNYPLPDVKCEFALYEVMVRGQFLKGRDMRDAVRRSTARRHTVQILPQRLPGVRFTTTCPADPHDDMEYHHSSCRTPFIFWRDNDLYASSLGVDVARLRNTSTGWYAHLEKWPDGRERAHPWNWRWTIHTPAGELVVRDSGGPGFDRPFPPDFDNWMGFINGAAYARRIQAIIPAQEIDSRASFYDVRVLQLERVLAP